MFDHSSLWTIYELSYAVCFWDRVRLHVRVFHIRVLFNRNCDYHLSVVDIKLSIEAHKFHPDSHNSTHSQPKTLLIAQAYLQASEMYIHKVSITQTRKWRTYSIYPSEGPAPTRTRAHCNGVSRVSTKIPNFERNSCLESAQPAPQQHMHPT